MKTKRTYIILFIFLLFIFVGGILVTNKEVSTDENVTITKKDLNIEPDDLEITYVGFKNKNAEIRIDDKSKVVSKTNKIDNGQSGIVYEINIISSKEGKHIVKVYNKKNNKLIGDINVNISKKRSTRTKTKEEIYEDELKKLQRKFNLKSSDSFYNLDKNQMDKYLDELNKLKEKYLGSNDKPMTRGKYDKWTDEAGDILVHFESSTFGINHGHAGIYSFIKNSTIEALGDNQKDFTYNGKTYKMGIRYLHDSINKVWKKKKRYLRMEVYNQSRQKNLNAAIWASNKKTYKDDTYNSVENKKTYYCVVKLPWDGECYNCATLVENAWNAQGRPLYVNKGNRAMDPKGLVDSYNTKIVETYINGK